MSRPPFKQQKLSSYEPEGFPPEYIPCEVFLELTSFFSSSSKRIKSINRKEKSIRKRGKRADEKPASILRILSIPEFGLPCTFDQDLYRAFLKLCDEMVEAFGMLPQPLKVPTKRLLHYAEKPVSSYSVKEAKNWFRVMKGTMIEGEVYHHAKKEFRAITTSIFSEVRMRGQDLDSGKKATTNLVWLSPWFLENYQYGYIRHFDLAFYNRLRKPIAKCLFSILETGWFASKGACYTKAYSTLAADLLIQRHQYLADVRQQLEPAHQELQRTGFLEHWEYRETTADFLILYYPGQKWFNDQKARLKRKKAHSGQSLTDRGDEQGRAILESNQRREEERKQTAIRKMREDMQELGQGKRLG